MLYLNISHIMAVSTEISLCRLDIEKNAVMEILGFFVCLHIIKEIIKISSGVYNKYHKHKIIISVMWWKYLLKQISFYILLHPRSCSVGLCTDHLLLLWLRMKGQPPHFKIIACLLFFSKVLFYSVIKNTESQHFFPSHGKCSCYLPLESLERVGCIGL